MTDSVASYIENQDKIREQKKEKIENNEDLIILFDDIKKGNLNGHTKSNK